MVCVVRDHLCAEALHGAGLRIDLDDRGVVHYNIAPPPTSWLLTENYTTDSEGGPHATTIGTLGGWEDRALAMSLFPVYSAVRWFEGGARVGRDRRIAWQNARERDC